jgi:hypothetical protein
VVFIRENIRLLFVLFVPVYFFIAQCSLQNRHSHISANGIVVTHSHPVKHADHEPINAHDHSESEICFYHLVHFDYFSVTPEIQFNFNRLVFTEQYLVTDTRNPLQNFSKQDFIRGPPQTSFSYQL